MVDNAVMAMTTGMDSVTTARFRIGSPVFSVPS
jgi:hypothetical protein